MPRLIRCLWFLCLLLMISLGWVARPATAQQEQKTLESSALADNSDTSATTAPARRRVQAARRGQDIVIDGQLDEVAWRQAPVIDGFRQREPVEGAMPSERTVVHVLYDDEALYIGARMHDASPDSIIARLGRRDADLDSDLFAFFVDPYLDRRTGFYFAVNAAGTLMDGVLMNDDWDDDSWDGVWQARTNIDEEGWVAEMRIPYSQLRFHEQEQYTWGINFRRDIARKNEELYIVYTPRSESGFVSRFVDLVGIEQIRPPRQLEMTPYVTARAGFVDHDEGDPFNDGSDFQSDIGADFKVGLTSNLTLNGTVNPDFGQVEVDPAVVNLSDRETFFPEKRPFFIEGANIFEFGYGGSNSNWGFNWGNPNFFYSRRIGRPPHGSLPDHDFADVPESARILGAAKLTGKLGDRWNVGTVQALTNRARADIAFEGEHFDAVVEPTAYYSVVRGQREFQEGRQALGFISTATLRSFQEDRLRDEINTSAHAFGLDGWTFLDADKTWVITGWLGGSHVRGTEQRITDLQRSALHYFQRPDAKNVHVDSSATSLSGLAGRVMLNKQRGHFYVNSALGFVSPGFDVNDLGFLFRTNVINGHFVAGYRFTEPTSFYRRINLNSSLFRSMDFDGNTVWTGVWGNSYIQFTNYWELYGGFALNPQTVSNGRTRGGPLTLNPPGYEVFGGAETDGRKAWVFGVEGFTYQSEGGDEASLWTSVEWKPAANVALSLSPNLRWSDIPAQWVGAFDDPTATATFGRRYVFAHLDQVTFSSNIRLNWTFTPFLSLQLFAQPLISAGDYTEFKELARPKSFDFTIYGQDNGSTFDPETLTADPDGAGPAAPIDLDNPDFNFKSLRGTAVLRWEFRPGSTLFLVWTQTRDHSEEIGQFNFGPSFDRLLSARADNIFMLKFTYWLSR